MFYSQLSQSQIPWRYGIRFNKENHSLCFDLHSDIIPLINTYSENRKEHNTKYAQSNGYKNFDFRIAYNKYFGFDSSATISRHKDVISLEFGLLPQNKVEEKSHYVKLTKSICELATYLRLILYDATAEVKDDTYKFQLFEIETAVYAFANVHAYPIQGYINPKLRQFMSELGEIEYQENRKIRDKISPSIKKLFGFSDDVRLNFITDGRFWLQVPGNACSIGTLGEVADTPISIGAPFVSHNLDSAVQQLGLLITFAFVLDCYYEKHPEQSYVQIPQE